MHPIVLMIAFYALVYAFIAYMAACRYQLYIARRKAYEAAPENHWARWRIPKDRKDLTFMQVFLTCYELLWVCTIFMYLVLAAIAILKANP